LTIGRLLGADYRPTNNPPVTYQCISSNHMPKKHCFCPRHMGHTERWTDERKRASFNATYTAGDWRYGH